MKLIYRMACCILAGLVYISMTAISAQASQGSATKTLLGLQSLDKMKPNGEYIIYVHWDASWRKAGSLAFDRLFRERTLDLSREFVSPPTGTGKENSVKIRLVQKGGGAAHIDSVFLGGSAPVTVRDIGDGLKKLSRKDYDVIDAFGKTIEIAFPAKTAGLVLHLTARVEAREISKVPFQFPLENLYREMRPDSSFYTYRLKPGIQSHKSEIFFKEYSSAGSGHPSGFTYGWVWNDAGSLYVKIDFTADNTMDGDKDYAKVYVKTEKGLREFKVSVPEQRWGKPLFTYTNKAAYQHKVYDFAIPFRELEANPPSPPLLKGGKGGFEEKELQLAFAAYGTSSPGEYNPSLAYDPVNNRYLVVYEKVMVNTPVIHGQLLNPDGTVFGPEFVISEPDRYRPVIAYDSVSRRFLVAWRGMSTPDIYGQMVNADGTLHGANFIISNAPGEQILTSVAYDSVNQRFLLAWADYRNLAQTGVDIYGQLVNSDGTLYNTAPNVNFIISNAAGDQYTPSAAYDSANQRFLIVWQGSAGMDIYGRLVNPDGGLNGADFIISNAANTQEYPSAAYDSLNKRFLVAWHDSRHDNTLATFDIYAQLVNADGALYNTSSNENFLISNATDSQYYAATGYDSANKRFLVAWQDSRDYATKGADIYAQQVNPDGTLNGANFAISDAANAQILPRIAYNAVHTNFLAAYQTDETSPGVQDVGITLVGIATISNPPPAPVLISPANGQTGLGTDVTFRWNKSDDPDGDTVSYDLFLCTVPGFAGCAPVTVAFNGSSVMYAGMINLSAILLGLGIGLLGFFTRRGRIFLLVAMLAVTGIVLASCGGGSGSQGQSPPEMSYTATGLGAGATYYWKVKANDGKGGTAESEVWSFTTQ